MEFSNDKTLRLAISSKIINKSDGAVPDARFSRSFENKRVNLEEFLQEIKKGHAYCPELRGARNSDNFAASDILSLDVDSGLTFDEALNEPFVAEHASILYTTASHTEEAHRFRVIFVLPRTITDGREMTRAMRGLALKFGGDSKVVDAAHLFYGSTNCRSHLQHRGLSMEALNALIERGRTSKTYNEGYSATVGRETRDFDTERLRLADGGSQLLIDIPKGIKVHCPEHIDRQASAFITENAQGIKGVSCSACGRVYWPKTVDLEYVDSFETDLQCVAAGKPLEGVIGSERLHLSRSNVELRHGQFLGSFSPSFGATFVKSAKGTGKTKALKDVVGETEGRVLVIGHRKTLVQDLCVKLGLDFYKRDRDDGASFDWNRRLRFGVTVDSIWMASVEQPFDLIVIDESEQVLSHLMSDTISNRRNSAFIRLQHLISKARRVVCCDADLGWLSLNSIMDWRNEVAPDERGLVIYKRSLPVDRTIHLYRRRKHVISALLSAVDSSNKCYVTSNIKKTINEIEKSLLQRNPTLRILSLTEDTKDKTLTEFLANPAEQVLRYDVILSSPKVSSGLDIAFEDGAQHIDDVFGIFEPDILNHYECDQQLSRVRSPKRTHVWLSHDDPGKIDVTPDVMRIRLSRDFMFGYLHQRYNEYGKLEIDSDRADNDKLLDLAVRAISRDELSRNSRRENFLGYKRAQGWKVAIVEDVESVDQVDEGESSHSTEMAFEQIDAAKKLSPGEYFDLLAMKKDGVYLDLAQRASEMRTELELFFGSSFDSELWKLWREGPSPATVMRYERLIASINGQDLETNYARGALESARLYSDGSMRTEAAITSGDLRGFVDYVRSNKTELERYLDVKFRSDYESNPIQSVNLILEKYGLTVDLDSKAKSKGLTISRYKLSEKKIEVLQAAVAVRKARR
jgi:hypothetical protein